MKNSDRLLGFRQPPRSAKERRSGVAAKRFVESRGCSDKIIAMLANGTKSSTIRQMVLDNNEGAALTASTLDKYFQLYRRFFIAPLEYATSAEGARDQPVDQRTIIARRLGIIPERVAEIESMERAAAIQLARCEAQYAIELALKLPLPGLKDELVACVEMNHRIIEAKMDLGQLTRDPQQVKITSELKVNDRERQELVEFGAFLMELIERSRKRNVFNCAIDVLGEPSNLTNLNGKKLN
jgi:hypothetical protein